MKSTHAGGALTVEGLNPLLEPAERADSPTLLEMRRLLAYVRVTNVIRDRLPQIVTALVQRAQPHVVTCFTCAGTGRIQRRKRERVCVACRGHGQRHVPGDMEARLVFQLLGLLKPTVHRSVRVTRIPNGASSSS